MTIREGTSLRLLAHSWTGMPGIGHGRAIAVILFAGIGWVCGCAKGEPVVSPPEKITREYLLSVGFEKAEDDREIVELKRARLRDVAKTLGFSLTELRSTLNQSNRSDIRTVDVRGFHFVVQSEVRDSSGQVVRGSLDDPNALCAVSVWLKPVPRPHYAPTTSVPRLRILNVLQQAGANGLRLIFEIDADGQTPIAFTELQVGVDFAPPGEPGRHYIPDGIRFSKGTADPVTVFPGKPQTLTVEVLGDFPANGRWNDFGDGKYAFTVGLSGAPKSSVQFLEYQFMGNAESEPFPVFVKGSGRPPWGRNGDAAGDGSAFPRSHAPLGNAIP